MRKNVYMIAIGGVGMSALAQLFRQSGYEVSGSDRAVYPPASDFLNHIGVSVMTPFSKNNIPEDADFVIVGNAVSSDNAEVVEVNRRSMRRYSLPSALFEFFMKDKRSVVVAGTHGKTTITAMLAQILAHGGMDPSFFVGGIPLNFNVPARSGSGPFFVIEGDEYDSAYFDKKAKFYHYRPRFLILTSIEFDHGDIYPDLPALKNAFEDLVHVVPEDGLIVACSDYPVVGDILKKARCRVLTYSSRDEGSDVYIEKSTSRGGTSRGIITWGGRSLEIIMNIPGAHNIANGVAAVVCGVEMGVPEEKALAGIKEYRGVKRRLEQICHVDGIRIIDDFAHHPTAVRETIEAARSFYRPARLVAIFEPRSNTSRRNVFEREYGEALSKADLAVLCPPYKPDAIPREERFSQKRVSELVNERGGKSAWFEELSRIPAFLAQEGMEGDLFLFMSNGDLGGIQKMTSRLLKKRSIISKEGENPEGDHDREDSTSRDSSEGS